MDDFKNTVIITGLGLDIKKEDLIQHFKRFGEIQKSNLVTTGSEGRVTYADSKTAEKAIKELDGKEINGNVIKVKVMDKCHNNDNIHDADYDNNTTNNQNDRHCDEHHKKNFGGGKGGKGGIGSSNVPSGNDGEDGEPGPGGKGGAGCKPAITNPKLNKRAFESNDGLANNMKNKYECSGGGKGGKGGIGGPNVPSGHDGEDGEPGPGGKGGAGGRPAVSKNDYTWNGNRNNDPWYTTWFGIGGPKKTNEEEHNSSGGGKGGKGGVGYNNIPSGHDGEDCEPGPGGKGGAGGTPTVSKNAYTRNGNWNNDPWYTRWLGIREPKKKNEQEHNSSGGGKGGVGYNNVPSGHKGEDGEAGPGGKGGGGGRPAM